MKLFNTFLQLSAIVLICTCYLGETISHDEDNGDLIMDSEMKETDFNEDEDWAEEKQSN